MCSCTPDMSMKAYHGQADRGDMRRSRKFCQRGSNFEGFFNLFFLFFLFDEGRKDSNTTISRPFKCVSLAGR